MSNHDKVLKDLQNRQWKRVGAPYEPVGLSVLLLTEGEQMFWGYRKNPKKNKSEPLVYYREEDDKEITDALYWDV